MLGLRHSTKLLVRSGGRDILSSMVAALEIGMVP